ncbi:Zinc phosphodiesterase ELAC protein 2 [Phytophthora pseudosyringae]|uniref:Zinc phosphodiesterase ELAC protein 2 n=1 Tax=Phytophthora pseudosyringae TaxID=221518 RepID=A0A8T1VKM8_9STRA|nr:Zinc phosphodiesterase ELAC protein 2 [Phytophthora pseudosyringae]
MLTDCSHALTPVKTPPNMVVQVQVLSVQSAETAPSLLLSTETRRCVCQDAPAALCNAVALTLAWFLRSFLFNVGDGTQRLCMEHHVRLAKLQRVFLTELRSHTVGGLPGMVLTVSDTGKPGLHVHGPPGTNKYLKATRHFLYRPEFKLEASEAPPMAVEAGKKKAKSCYEDDEVVVHAVAVAKPRAGAKRKLNENPSSPSPSSEGEMQSSHVSVSYVVETRTQRGKFLVDKAMALGVPKGKLFGQLHHGKDVTLPDGRVVQSSDCVLPSVPAAGCVIVSCPTTAHVDALASSGGFKRYQETEGKPADVHVEVVFHLGGVEVLRQPKYAAWARSFGAETRHVLLGHGACAQKTVYRASAKLQAQLHAVFPRAFPSNEAHELRDSAEPFSRVVPEAAALELTGTGVPAASDEEKESSEPASSKLVLGESMLKYILAPQARRGFDASRCWPRLDFDQIRESVSSSAEIVAKVSEDSSAQNADDDLIDGRITFLGTGCAIPSKYRNVTGMYLELPTGAEGDDNWAGMMLDCGEGSLGQMYRYAAGDNKRLQELVDRLKCVWISHNHADHHLGLLRLLSYRSDASNTEPLLVIGPTPLRFWLDEYAAQDPTVRGKFTFVENYSFDEDDSRSEEVETHAEAARVRAWLRETLSISQLECVPVKHAHQSYAAVVTFVNGAKMAFSGDCRPSEKLGEKAKGAFLLVHEATFEDELAKEAKDKAHCTMAEAIEVGRQANARHLLLTHFSQRYPKMAVLSSATDEAATEQTPMEVLTAIDMLSLRFRELRQPNLMDVCTQLMTMDEDEEGDVEATASLKARQEREERKKQKSVERGEEQ